MDYTTTVNGICKFNVGDPVRMFGASTSGKVIAIVPPGESPQRVLSRFCDETGTFLSLPNGVVRDHEAYLIQVSDSLCRFPEVKTLQLDSTAVHVFKEMDKRRQDSFKVEVVKDKSPHTGDPTQEALNLRVTYNGIEWKSLRILSREVRLIVDALMEHAPAPKKLPSPEVKKVESKKVPVKKPSSSVLSASGSGVKSKRRSPVKKSSRKKG